MPIVIRIIVYPVFAVLTFMFFLMISLPFDQVKTRVEAEVEKRLGEQYDIQIGDLSMAPLSSLKLKEVIIRERKKGGITLAKLDRIKVHFDLIPLLWGSVRMGFDLKASESRIYGRFDQADSRFNIEATMKNVNLAHFPILEAKWGLVMMSDIDGQIDIEIYPQTPLRNNGSIQLQINTLKLNKSQLKGLFTLPAIDMAQPGGKSKIDIVMNRGSVEVRSLLLKGADLNASLGGKIYLAQRVDNFRFNIRGKIGLGEKISEELPFLMIVEKQKGADGLYPITVTGQVRRPNIRIGRFRVPI